MSAIRFWFIGGVHVSGKGNTIRQGWRPQYMIVSNGPLKFWEGVFSIIVVHCFNVIYIKIITCICDSNPVSFSNFQVNFSEHDTLHSFLPNSAYRAFKLLHSLRTLVSFSLITTWSQLNRDQI